MQFADIDHNHTSVKTQDTESISISNNLIQFSLVGFSRITALFKDMHLEVGWVYAELVGVQGLQRGQVDSQLTDVFSSICNGQNNLLPMSAQMRGAGTDVQMGKVGLGAWERGKHPMEEGNASEIYLNDSGVFATEAPKIF